MNSEYDLNNFNMSDESGVYIGSTLRIFLSHSTEDLTLIKFIKSQLEWFGLDVFVAHEDIEPSTEWESAIIENLKSTDIFVPIITGNYYSSNWTDQESGIAFSIGKDIIPVSIGDNLPRGFVNRYQALRFDASGPEVAEKSCEKIIETIRKKEKFTKSLLDSIINTLPTIPTFDQAGYKFETLSTFESFTPDQINAILYHSINNLQIYGSNRARSNLDLLIKNNKKNAKTRLIKELKLKRDSWG